MLNKVFTGTRGYNSYIHLCATSSSPKRTLFLRSYKLILDIRLDWNLFIICLNQIKNVKETFRSERDNKNHFNYLSGYHSGQQSQSII